MSDYSGDLPAEYLNRLNSELTPGENLLWAGRSREGAKSIVVYLLVLFLGLFIIGASAIMYSALRGPYTPSGYYLLPGGLAAGGVCFLLYTINIVRPRGTTVYGVTNQRIIKILCSKFQSVFSIYPHEIKSIEQSGDDEGTGQA
jgi:hypothetical protein